MEKSLFDIVGRIFEDVSEVIISAFLGFWEFVFGFIV